MLSDMVLNARSIKRWLPLVFVASVIISLAKDLQWYPKWMYQKVFMGDFSLHFVGSGVLAVFIYFSSHKQLKLGGLQLPFYTVLFAAGTILEECSQLFRPHRGFSFVDMAANILGIIVFTRLAKYLSQKNYVTA
ncbi:hypothetical protein GC194_09935 [bacterium]|nr:hypothetical protein [bacterium]